VLGECREVRIGPAANQDLDVALGNHATALALESPGDDGGATTPATGIHDLIDEVNEFLGKPNRDLLGHPKTVPYWYHPPRADQQVPHARCHEAHQATADPTTAPPASRTKVGEAGSRQRREAGEPPRAFWETIGSLFPMEVRIDDVGRIVVPKPLRDALGLVAGSTLDISRYGAGLQLVPAGRTARLVEEAGVLVATGETEIDDDTVFALIDAGRR
jgi:AbrB family looped-hinge helix DNA binding protein